MLSKYPRLKLGLEVISFQNDDIGAKIEEQVTSLIAKIKDKTYKDKEDVATAEEISVMKKLTKDRFGLKMDFETDKMLAAILPFYSNRNHIFLHQSLKGLSEREAVRLLKSDQEVKGTVNIDKAKVTGVFSEYPNQLFMNYKDLIGINLTAAEITAVQLHEVGHAFYACEYSDRFEASNQILANVFKEVSGRKDKKDMAYIYRELKKINPELKEQEVERLTGDDKVIAGYYWFKYMVGAVQSQMPVKKYDETSFEALADNFVSRLGYGRHLVTALEKLHKSYMNHPNSVLQKVLYMMQVLSLVSMFFIAGLAISSLSLGGVGIIYALLQSYKIFGVMLVVWMMGDDKKDMTYDDLRDRYKRVRNDAVEQLKVTDIHEDQLTAVLATIRMMDKTIGDTNTSKNAFNQFSWLLFPANRRADTSIKEQRLIEDLVANDLFIKAAELKQA